MSSFDKVIGYDSVKREIKRLCDVIKNKEKYQSLGVTPPRGLMLYGKPGVGKTLMATCFIEESGKKSFICKKNLPKEEFIKHIKDVFEEAKRTAPSIILLDDLDKFSTEGPRPNQEEYSTIQSCIDDLKDYDVFVLATVNSFLQIPDSLLRSGRFDLTIEIEKPKGKDAEKIIKHYLSTKKSIADLDTKQLARILNDRSCAELESIINQAGIYAGFENKTTIEFDDILRASIRLVYEAPETIQNNTPRDDEIIAYHEAGHAVVAELLEPGSVTIVSVGAHEGLIGGFTSYYRDEEKYWRSIDSMKNRICCLLGGKCATEIHYGKIDTGCVSDIERAAGIIRRFIAEYGSLGFEKCSPVPHFDLSDNFKYKQECAIVDELSHFYQQVKELLNKNKNFLDKVATVLQEKKLITEKDIKTIKETL